MTSPDEIVAALDVAVAFNANLEIARRIGFLVEQLSSSGSHALILGISGGVDSATAGRLCQLAVVEARQGGLDAKFIAMRLPYGVQHDEADAQKALAFIEPDHTLVVDIQPASDAALASVEAAGLVFRDPSQRAFVHGNIKARQRMIAQYAVAGTVAGLVIGTDHAAEAVTGFFTKHGDGAADLVPLAGLTKRRVRALAAALGAPDELVNKVPTADLDGLTPGRPDEDELGLTYQHIDDFLEQQPGVPVEVADAIVLRYDSTAHKRRPPVAP